MELNELIDVSVDAGEQSGEEEAPAAAISSADSESGFKDWYAQQSSQLGINPNPDDPRHNYDYRAAYGAGVIPDESGHFDSRFKGEKHENLVIDGVNTKSGQPEPPPVAPQEAIQSSPATGMAEAASKKWSVWDEARGVSPDEFRKTASDVLGKLSQAAGKPLDSKEAIELLGLTASNETNMGRYMKAPGKSKQRGVMQITDDTIEDLYRYMRRTPELMQAVDSLRNPSTPITSDVETNLPLSIALARVKYMMDKQAIPMTPAKQAEYYKRVYNTGHPAAKATPKGALKNYEKYFIKGGI